MPNWIGLDVHKRTCHATVLDERGVIVQTKLQNEPEELKQFFENFDDAKVAMEAAYFWQPVYELIEQLGHEVVLAHPKETRIIAKRKVKSDAKDSEALAYLLQLGWLPTAEISSDKSGSEPNVAILLSYATTPCIPYPCLIVSPEKAPN
jgi:transposase